MKRMSQLLFSLCLSGLSFGMLSCTHAEKASDRVFETRELWVQRTTEAENLGFRKINRMKPLIYKNLVIAANGVDGIAGFDRNTGEIKWRQHIANGAEPSAALINDRLFIGASDGQLYSLQAGDGKILWTFPTRIETLSEPLLADGVLYLLTGNNTLYALDAASGKQLWLYSRQDPSSLSIRGGSKPALRNGTLYVGFSDGSIVALLASNGAVKWEKQLSRNKKFRDLDSDPLIENDYLYVLGFDDQIYCLRAGTGETVWHSELGGYGSILLSGDRLYYATTNGEFAALNKETGEKVWTFPLKQGIATSASLYKGLVIFGESQGALRILDASNGKLISSFDPGRGILSPPMVDEKSNRVYFISNEANLYGMEIGWKIPQHIPYLR
jgi:outer membrane protein assembly factor BamB